MQIKQVNYSFQLVKWVQPNSHFSSHGSRSLVPLSELHNAFVISRCRKKRLLDSSRGEGLPSRKCDSIQILFSFSSPCSMYFDHVMFWSLWFLSLFFSVITLITSVCLVLMWSCVPVHMAVFLFFMYVCMMCVSVRLCVCLCVFIYVSMYSSIAHPYSPTTRVPGGECRQWGCAWGCCHPRDQCDRRGRRENGQRRLPKAAPWRSHRARWRHYEHHLRGHRGPPRSRLRHTGSGGQEAEVCEAIGGEWGFWDGLHREESVLRSCPSFPLPHSWGNLGNVCAGVVWTCMMTCPFTFFLHWAPSPSLHLTALFLSSVYSMSFIHLLSPLWL